MNIRLIIISIVFFFIILLSEYVAYASFHQTQVIKSVGLEKSLLVLGVIFPILFIVSMFYSYKHYSLLNSWINTIGGVWLGILLFIFIASLVIFIILMLNYYFNLNLPTRMISGGLVLFVLLVMAYGIWNASNPRIVRMNINSEKLAQDWKGKKIVIISDVHLGTERREGFLRKVIEKINKEKPDVVFILGDLIDGPCFPYEKWFSEFSNMKPQFGNIYIEGNHEKYSQEYNKFKSSLHSSLINLTDKKAIINNTQIIGLDYVQNESAKDIQSKLLALQYDKSKPSIVLVHDPKSVKDLSDEGVTLTLSGHTHGGQFFPFTTLVNYLYKKYTHGITLTGDTTSITSYGVGTAVIPIRVGTIPEIIVLTIK